MLETNNRRLFLESIRQPDGYELDHVVGTTYSLDLVTLLTVPLTFTMLDWQDANGKPRLDPLLLLEALRRNAERLSIFCQAGQIYVPKQHRVMYAYLERAVIEVGAPSEDGVFHPKVWVARYTSKTGPVRYKLIVQSRNLTFDRSWDVILCLDGELQDRHNAYAKNHSLGNFVQALPHLAVRSVSDHHKDKIEQMQYEIRRVKFEYPDGVDDVAFWPLGIAGHRTWPFEHARVDRMMVVSPFLTASSLDRLGSRGKQNILVSRQDSLEKMTPADLGRYEHVHVLMDDANPEPMEQPGDTNEASAVREDGVIAGTQHDGLHAKIYAADAGWDASLWVGSTNATHQAFHANVEFLVELTGKKSRIGIDALLGKPDDKWSLAHLLAPYSNSSEDDVLESEEVLGDLEVARRTLAGLQWKIDISDFEDEGFDLVIGAAGLPAGLPDDIEIHCRPVSLQDLHFKAISPSTGFPVTVTFTGLSLESITTFIAFRVLHTATDEQADFLVNAELINEPEGRREGLLRAMLRNRNDVLRYILLLLSEGSVDRFTEAMLAASSEAFTVGASDSAGLFDIPLLESLLRTLHSQPEKLKQIQHMVEELRATGGEHLLPDGFLAVWEPIWDVVKEGDV